jgi:hypothetical protein
MSHLSTAVYEEVMDKRRVKEMEIWKESWKNEQGVGGTKLRALTYSYKIGSTQLSSQNMNKTIPLCPGRQMGVLSERQKLWYVPWWDSLQDRYHLEPCKKWVKSITDYSTFE